MTSKYQTVIIGAKISLINDILATLFRHTRELGISDDSLIVINQDNFVEEYRANAPVFCLYFGDESGKFNNLDILENLVNDASLVLPVVKNIKKFSQAVPEVLHKVNGFELTDSSSIESLVGSILEGFGLLRLSRRLFISYKRDESSSVAIQLFEQLEKRGFDVFLDTHSIRLGEPFQDELWQRLADTDIVVLLNTPGFLKSNWTKKELAEANAMSIGILQLVWPEYKPEPEAGLSIPIYLNASDFVNSAFTDSKSYLVESMVKNVSSLSESLRARSLAARQDNIITEFITSANKLSVDINLQPEKFITIEKADGTELVIIPTVGVPQAFTYNQSEELVARVKRSEVKAIYLLYDHRNIRDKWLKHLSWLDNYLPIKTIKIVEAEKWLSKI
jgi:hypothetical protein